MDEFAGNLYSNDLENSIKFIEIYQKDVLNLYHDYNRMKKALETSQKQCRNYQEKEKKLYSEIESLQEIIRLSQSNACHELKLQESNEQLKKDLEQLKIELTLSEKSHKEETEEMRLRAAREKEKYEHRLLCMAKRHKDTLERVLQEQRREVEQKDALLLTSQNNLERMRNDFEKEFTKYKTEWQEKLSKCQNKNSSKSEGHEIFRKKLLHERQQSDREKAVLKRRIEELEMASQGTKRHASKVVQK